MNGGGPQGGYGLSGYQAHQCEFDGRAGSFTVTLLIKTEGDGKSSQYNYEQYRLRRNQLDGGKRDKKAQKLAIQECFLFCWKVPFRNIKPKPRERPRTRMWTPSSKSCVTADLRFSVDVGKEIQTEALKGQK